MKGRTVLLTVMISSVAGAVAGILFAPEKGTRTRREISKRSQDLTDMARDEFEDFIKFTQKKYNTAKDQTDDLIEIGEKKTKELKKKLSK